MSPRADLGTVANRKFSSAENQTHILWSIVWTGFIWLRLNSVVGFCEHSNESVGAIKVGESLGRSCVTD
jgi:hypothetical protein